MNITQATPNDIEVIADLFNQYRQFYQQSSDIDAAKTFLSQRLKNDESVIFLATNADGEALGFTQLYPTFCSVLMQPIFVLYDLFVSENARKQGVAKQLMQRAEDYAREKGAAELSLATAKDNRQAQALYEQTGYRKDEVFWHYTKPLSTA